jgi:hypothetical protein
MLNKSHVQVLAVEASTILLIGCITFTVMYVRTLSQSTRARAFLSDMMKLEVGKSTFEDARLVAQRYGGIPWWINYDSMQCTYQRCQFRFVFENKPLSSAYIEPHIGFIGGIEVRTGIPYIGLIGDLDIRNGVLAGRNIYYARYSKRSFTYNVRELLPALDNTPQAEAMKWSIGLKRMNVDQDGIPSAVSIDFGPSTSPGQRVRAYEINVSCLSKIFGCASPSDIFPAGIPYRGTPYQTRTEEW